ncbi:MAG: arylsulfatase [Planctomycetaceae bacterium]|nr:arylsulfatase [Planctomycetaceae bacterium]
MSQFPSNAPAGCPWRFSHRLQTEITALAFWLVAAVVPFLISAQPLSAAQAERPNIVFILADDQGYGDVGVLNKDAKIPTPNLDRIAREGMYFTDGHSSSAVCTPTRYSVLTGRYHWRTRLQKGVLGGFSAPLIAPDRLTVAGLLKQQGYHTGCFGKWHLGFDWPLKDGGTADDNGDFSGGFKKGWEVDYTGEIQNGPLDVGFDTFFGISASLDMPPYVYLRDRKCVEVPTTEKTWIRKGPAAESFEAVNVLPDITRETVSYIKSRAGAAQDGTPFFVYFPLNAPHTPIVPTEDWQGKSGINAYADFVMQVDWSVGQVLKVLDEQGLTDSTLLFFTTDNGCSPSANFGELRAAGHEPSYIYRGHKADIYEGGHRVPYLVRWPGRVKAGSYSDQIVGQLDLMATCADILDIDLPADVGEDSVSILPALLGEDDGPIRQHLVSQSINGSFAIRDGNWKLALCPGSGGWSDPRPGRFDFTGMPEFQLFDLATDPGEQTNLAEKHPERVQEMKATLEKLVGDGRSTPGPKQVNDVEVTIVKPIPRPPKAKKN